MRRDPILYQNDTHHIVWQAGMNLVLENGVTHATVRGRFGKPYTLADAIRYADLRDEFVKARKATGCTWLEFCRTRDTGNELKEEAA